MKKIIFGKTIIVLVLFSSQWTNAQNVNIWQGDETKAKWGEAYKWKLKHAPLGTESVYFREPNSAVIIDRTIDLNNSMLLYGQELSLEGNGNLNFWNSIKNKSTVYIPASAAGYANLTLQGNLSIKGNISLAAKAYGTSASKGSITLKNRSKITGELAIGNNGNGTGQVFIQDQANFNVSSLDIQTMANKGGSAEIHILSGSINFEKGTNPFKLFSADPSRKIILGPDGTIRIKTSQSAFSIRDSLVQLVKEKHLITTPGCKIGQPTFQDNTIIIKGMTAQNTPSTDELIAQVQKIKIIKAAEINTPEELAKKELETKKTNPIARYFVFFAAILLLVRPEETTASVAKK